MAQVRVLITYLDYYHAGVPGLEQVDRGLDDESAVLTGDDPGQVAFQGAYPLFVLEPRREGSRAGFPVDDQYLEVSSELIIALAVYSGGYD